MAPALVGLGLKLVMLLMSRWTRGADAAWIGFIAVFAMHNLSEVLVFTRFAEQLSADALIRSYYVCCVMVSIYGLYYVSDFIRSPKQKLVWFIAAIPAVLLIIAIVATDTVIAGYSFIEYSITAIKGEQYKLFQYFSLANMVIAIVVLSYNYRTATDPKQQLRYAYTFFALIPMILATTAVILLMMAGYRINAAMVFPIASTLFLIISVQGRDSYTASDLRRWLPFTQEYRVRKAVEFALSQYALENIQHDDLMVMLERAMIQYKHGTNDANLCKAAKSMGVSSDTLDLMLKRMHIPH